MPLRLPYPARLAREGRLEICDTKGITVACREGDEPRVVRQFLGHPPQRVSNKPAEFLPICIVRDISLPQGENPWGMVRKKEECEHLHCLFGRWLPCRLFLMHIQTFLLRSFAVCGERLSHRILSRESVPYPAGAGDA
jgi:hypothetical protein